MNRLISGLQHITAASVSGPMRFIRRGVTTHRRDMADGGGYRITELVYYNGELARRRVKLFRREGRGYRFVRETWSDAVTGRYTFNNIAPGKYLVLADDFLALKNAVVADLIDAEPMP